NEFRREHDFRTVDADKRPASTKTASRQTSKCNRSSDASNSRRPHNAPSSVMYRSQLYHSIMPCQHVIIMNLAICETRGDGYDGFTRRKLDVQEWCRTCVHLCRPNTATPGRAEG